MADKFEDLRTFVALADAGGVSAAAADLGIAKSAVSRRLGELEGRLGATLVARTTRSFALTDEGRDLLIGARRILADLAVLERSAGGQPAKPLVVAGSSDVHETLLPMLTGIWEELPAIRLVSGGTEPAAVDVEFLLGGRAGRDLRLVGEAAEVLCCSPGYLAARGVPSTADDLRSHDFVSIAGAPRAMPSAAGRLEVPDGSLAAAAAEAGAGFALLLEPLVRARIARGSLVMVAVDLPSRSMPLLARIRVDAPEAASVLVDRVAQYLNAVIA